MEPGPEFREVDREDGTLGLDLVIPWGENGGAIVVQFGPESAIEAMIALRQYVADLEERYGQTGNTSPRPTPAD